MTGMVLQVIIAVGFAGFVWFAWMLHQDGKQLKERRSLYEVYLRGAKKG